MNDKIVVTPQQLNQLCFMAGFFAGTFHGNPNPPCTTDQERAVIHAAYEVFSDHVIESYEVADETTTK